MITELRSDTFTLPSPGMLEAMMKAPVGDDVFGEDPSIRALEAETATFFGMEAGIFCPSGTMTNQVAIKCHTQPGDEVICEQSSHVYLYEGGGIAFNSGCQVKLLTGDRGRLEAEQIAQSLNPDDIHKPASRLISLENTANRGGGSTYELNELEKIREFCSSKNLMLHLDGARLWNALVANEEDPKSYGRIFDSISVCYSKGMGAPVGSVLIGKEDYIKKARRIRKVLGGGMRQGGYLAAACLYALEHNINRMATDHLHAKQIAEALIPLDFVGHILPVETNIVIAEIKGRYAPISFCEYLNSRYEIRCFPISTNQVRMVTHLGISHEMITRFVSILHDMR